MIASLLAVTRRPTHLFMEVHCCVIPIAVCFIQVVYRLPQVCRAGLELEVVMAIEATIEQRLEAVEQAVAELQQRLATSPSNGDWLQQISGSFKNEPAFAQVLQYGRSIREADRPAEDSVP
jgi:hypothetical protein